MNKEQALAILQEREQNFVESANILFKLKQIRLYEEAYMCRQVNEDVRRVIWFNSQEKVLVAFMQLEDEYHDRLRKEKLYHFSRLVECDEVSNIRSLILDYLLGR